MRKIFMISGILILLAAAVIIVLVQTHAISSSPALSNGMAGPATQTASTPGITGTKESLTPSPAKEAMKQTYLEKIETGFVKPKDFTQGVWIKKYPGNYACFKFETPQGVKIITDPYQMSETLHPDIVTESHQHSDHTDVSDLTGSYKLITEAGVYNVKGIKINGYPGKHNTGDTDVTNNIFVFEIGGIKIAHFASQGELPDKETLDRIGKVDILLIQVFDPGMAKLILKDCVQIMDGLKPKIVIPEHGMAGASDAIAEYFQIPAEYASTGEIYLTRLDLDAIQGIRIIDLDTGD